MAASAKSTRPSVPQPSMAGPSFWAPASSPEDYSQLYRTAWNTVLLLGNPLPGVAWITGQRHQKIDKKPTPGVDGQQVTNLGTEPAVINIRLEMWTPQQMLDWSNLVPLLEPRPGKPRTDALSIYHPALAIHRISDVYLKTVGILQPGKSAGVMEVTIQFYEWKPVMPVGSKDVKKSGLTNPGAVKQALPPPMRTRPPSATENHP